MVRASLSRGSNVNLRGPGTNNKTCLMAAMQRQDTAVASLLLAQPNIDVNATDSRNWTALHFAVYDETASFMKLLLTNPAINLERKNSHGHTPLMLAVIKGKTICVKVLLDIPGIDLDTKDLKGRPLKTFAMERPSIGMLFVEAMTKREDSVEDEVGRKRTKLDENPVNKKKRKSNQLDATARQASLWVELKKFRLKQNKTLEEERVKNRETEEAMAREGEEARERAAREFKVKISDLVKANHEEMARMDQQVQERQERLTRENQERLIHLKKRQQEEESQMLTALLGQDSKDEEEVVDDVAQAAHIPPPAPDCPICYEPMAPPTRIFQCGAGHLVCGTCRPKLQVFNCLELKPLNVFLRILLFQYFLFCRSVPAGVGGRC